MNMVAPNVGKLQELKWMLKSLTGEFSNYIVALYKNDYTPVDTSELEDFTPADFPGYIDVLLTRASFDDPVIVDDVAEMTYPTPPTYTCTGGAGQLVYGWFMVRSDDFTLLFAQRFDTPRNMTNGATESLNPFTISLKTFD